MKSKRVANFKQFHNIVEKYSDDMRFRGVADSSFQLTPKIGRVNFIENFNHGARFSHLVEYEEYLINEFKKYAPQHLTYIPKDEWEWWAIAQHHGLATRLLDWTDNPLVAAYFAVENQSNQDCALYVTDISKFNSNLSDVDSPLEVDEIYTYYPPHISQRIAAQKGMFTVHFQPNEPFTDKKMSVAGAKYFLEKVIIPKECKEEFKRVLNLYGINGYTIYPGLDGIASYLEWKTLSCNNSGE